MALAEQSDPSELQHPFPGSWGGRCELMATLAEILAHSGGSINSAYSSAVIIVITIKINLSLLNFILRIGKGFRSNCFGVIDGLLVMR